VPLLVAADSECAGLAPHGVLDRFAPLDVLLRVGAQLWHRRVASLADETRGALLELTGPPRLVGSRDLLSRHSKHLTTLSRRTEVCLGSVACPLAKVWTPARGTRRKDALLEVTLDG
jgi:hypothetical protein